MSKIELFGLKDPSTGRKENYNNNLIMIFLRLNCEKSGKIDLRTSKKKFQIFINFLSRNMATISTFLSEIGNLRPMESTSRCQEEGMDFFRALLGILAENSRSCELASRQGKNANKVSRIYYKLYRYIRIVYCERPVDNTWWLPGPGCEISISANTSLEAGHGLHLNLEWHSPLCKVVFQLCKRLMRFSFELLTYFLGGDCVRRYFTDKMHWQIFECWKVEAPLLFVLHFDFTQSRSDVDALMCASTVYACMHVGLCIYVCMDVMHAYTLVCYVYIHVYMLYVCVYMHIYVCI